MIQLDRDIEQLIDQLGLMGVGNKIRREVARSDGGGSCFDEDVNLFLEAPARRTPQDFLEYG